MKRNKLIVICLLGGALSMASCNNDEQLTNENVTLEVSANVSKTRSAIEGTTLPEKCSYGIFAMVGNSQEEALENGTNTEVYYENGINTISKDIYLPDNVDAAIYAYYPYNEAYSYSMEIEAISQTDYLYGSYTSADGEKMFVNQKNPKAFINFKHAMARVIFKIKKAENNEDTYKIPSVSLKNVLERSTFDLYQGALSLSWGNTELTAEITDNELQATTDEITVDFLVIPASPLQTVILSIDNMPEYNLPTTNWQSGQQYTYTVTIKKGGSLEVNQAEISEWKNNEQNGLEVGDDNYVMAVGGSIAEAVDLGLSVKWASWNVGASAPEEYGGLYFLEDPTGKVTSRSDNNQFPFSEYVSGTKYDIAHAQWGSNWRLPDDNDISELLQQCYWDWTIQNDVSGYKVTGKNGNSIFLPSAGFAKYDSSNRKNEGTEAYYWSGSEVSSSCGHCLLFTKETMIRLADDGYPTTAYAVRPVTD